VTGTGVEGIVGRVVVSRTDFTLDVDVEVRPGEVVAVLGPNGAGKSTLLRAVCGLTPLTLGSLTLGGVVVDDPARDVLVASSERGVGLVFQDYRLFPHLSVLDNVAFGPRSAGRSRSQSRADAVAWVERLRLTALVDRRPHELSGGQSQRVALARALAAPRPHSCSTSRPPRSTPPPGSTYAATCATTCTSSRARRSS